MGKIITLGTGWPVPNPERCGTSQIIEVDGENLLFDCGNGATLQLVKAGIEPTKIKRLFISHMHYDHIADYAYLILSTWLCGRTTPIEVYAPVGFQRVSKNLIDEVLKIHIESSISPRLPEFSSVKIYEMKKEMVVKNNKWKISTTQVEHIPNSPCHSFRIDTQNGSIAISGDTRPSKNLINLAKNVDILIHECTFMDKFMDSKGIGGHTGPIGLGKVAQDSHAKKLVVTHLGPYGSSPTAVKTAQKWLGEYTSKEVLKLMVEQIKENYDGEVILAEDLMSIKF